MKLTKLFTIAIFTVLTASAAFAEDIKINETNFPDKNFRNWALAQTWGSDGWLSAEEIDGITSISVDSKSISDLTGIKYFTALEYLDCSTNQLTSLDVSGLTNLEYLICSSNKLSLLNVSGLTNFIGLDCSDNLFFSLDDISGLKNLTYLGCNNNQFTSLDVSGLTTLEELFCGYNQLSSLTVLGLTNLTHLYCEYNQLFSLDLTTNTNLIEFYGSYQTISVAQCSGSIGDKPFSIEVKEDMFLEGIKTYIYDGTAHDFTEWIANPENADEELLVCSRCGEQSGRIRNNACEHQFTQWEETTAPTCATVGVKTKKCELCGTLGTETEEILSGCVAINATNFPDYYFRAYIRENFDADGDRFITAEEIADIEEILLVNENITDLTGINYFTGLAILVCYGTQLTSLDVSGLINLWGLGCLDTQLASLNVSGLTNLEILGCEQTQLTSLDVSGLKNLGALHCYNNKKLTSLDVSGLTNLESLYCDDNQLTSLDVLGLTNLTYLDCNNNQLTSLDVLGLTNLTNLNCYNNQLTSLDVSGLTNLTNLNCYNNQLTSLDVSGLTNLESLYCYNNQLTSLNVSGLTNLRTLWCQNNQLSSLDLTKNTKLTTSFKGENQEPTIAVAKCSGIASEPFEAETGKAGMKLTGTKYYKYAGHSFTDWEITQEPTCAAAGVKTAKCALCGASGSETEEIPALAGCVAIDETNFPDDNFRTWALAQTWGSDGWLTAEEIDEITEIDVSEKNISNLKGIEFFTALKTLNCSGNQLASLNVSGLSNLETLSCPYNDMIGEFKIAGLNKSITTLFTYAPQNVAQHVTGSDCDNSAHGSACSVCGGNAISAEHNNTKCGTVCSICGENAIEHNYPEEWEERTAAKCEIKGAEFKVCTREDCGHEITQEISALEHKFENYTSNNNATCTADGTETAICSRENCGEKDTRNVKNSALGHDYTSIVTAPTCTTKGFTTYTCSRGDDEYIADDVPALEHDFTKWIINPENDKEELEVCSFCNEPSGEKRDIICEHEFTELGTLISAATCEKSALHKAKCKLCGAEHESEILTGAALEHNFDAWKVTSLATCSAEGVETEMCSRCGALGVKTQAIAKAEHTFLWIITTPATCEDEGEIAQVCLVCNAHGETQILAIVGENFGEWYATKIATCEEQGEEVRTRCDNGVIDTETRKTGYRPHSFAWTITTAATCETNGTMSQKCLLCGLIGETQAILANGHKFTNWKLTLAPLCNSQGSETEQCSLCDKLGTATRSVPRSPHSFTDWETTTQPTCTETGKKTERCGRCDALGNQTATIPQLTGEECSVGFDVAEKTTITAYPNPTKGMVYLSETCNVKVYSMQGKLVFEGSTGTIDFAPFAPGMYILRVGNETITVVRE